MMKILFYLGHPAHFHLFKNVIDNLKDENHNVLILIKHKDILENLLQRASIPYINIRSSERTNNTFRMIVDIIIRDFRTYLSVRKFKPDLMIGSSPEISHVGFLLRIPSIITHEDDVDNMPLFANIAFPTAKFILSPTGCRQGKWHKKTINYDGYHELAYLHPNNFRPNKNIVNGKLNLNKKNFILRFSKFNAHHDKGISGINDKLALKIISILEKYGDVFISSERELKPQLNKYILNINPLNMHHYLFYCDLLICDSQSMAVEASVLGVPSIRFNKFAENFNVTILEELENKYHLTYGINIENPERVIKKIHELVNMPNIKEIWAERKEKMLSEKINVTSFITWFVKNYPESTEILKKNTNFQKKFR